MRRRHIILHANRGQLRLPSGYQGWAPGTTDHRPVDANMDELRSVARGQLRLGADALHATRRHRREHDFPYLDSRSGGIEGFNDPTNPEQLGRNPPEDHRENTEGGSSLRSAALFHAAQRRATSGSHSRSPEPDPAHNRERIRDLTEFNRELQRNVDNRRQEAYERLIREGSRRPRHLEDYHSESSRRLEEAIKYLEGLRYCESYVDRCASAVDRDIINGGPAAHHPDDLILDTSMISKPQPSSWLRVGGVFSGSQCATSTSTSPSFHLSTSARRAGAGHPGRSQRRTAANPSVQTLRGPWLNHVISRTSNEHSDDTWPVKVTITSIDYESMTLTGAMEAFNVPNKSTPARDSSITTHLEGEIVDFNQYTLETKSFNADSSVDSTYWRKLEPFKSLADNEVAKNLVSRRWLCEELGQKWILMRWKGWCTAHEFTLSRAFANTLQRSVLSLLPMHSSD